jgi:phenylacetate-CoA ligase
MKRTDLYWDASTEALRQPQLEALQVQRLQHIARHAARSPFYRQRWQGLNLEPGAFKSPEDIRQLPFTTKQDLRDHYPYGFLCLSKDRLVRLHVSSGTTGQATAMFYSQRDIETWADLMARCMYMSGARPGDTFQNMTG